MLKFLQMRDELLDQSSQSRQQFFSQQEVLLSKLASEGQHPRAMVIACSDARVTPKMLFGAGPGELFMLRNIANIIPPYHQTEIGVVSALEFAILHLEVPHIIVLGHTDCGGIRALDTHLDMSKEPALARWIEMARPAHLDVDFLMQSMTDKERHLAIVERNVVCQMRNIQSYPFIRSIIEQNQLKLHGWVYCLSERCIRFYDPDNDTFTFE